MFLKGQKIEAYKGFGLRLRTALERKGISDTRQLAEELDKQCSSIINMRKKKPGAQPKDPISYIMRNIQIHLNKEEAYKIPSAYMYAYSVVLDCSLDYLYGRSKIMASDLSIADICEKTGLSESSVNNLVEEQQNYTSDSFSFSNWWSRLLSDPYFQSIPMSWLIYAGKLVDIFDIKKKISAREKATQDIKVTDKIVECMFFEENEKSFRIDLREKEDIALGAYSKMISLMEHTLDEYAVEWAQKQNPDKEEIYYQNDIKLRKDLNKEINTDNSSTTL